MYYTNLLNQFINSQNLNTNKIQVQNMPSKTNPSPSVFDAQVSSMKTKEPKQDTFINKKGKVCRNCLFGITIGGIIGALKEKFCPKSIPSKITDKYNIDVSKLRYSPVYAQKEDALFQKDAAMLKNAVKKLLETKELTKEELEFLQKSKLVLPEDVKFLIGKETPFKIFLQKQVLSNEIEDGGKYLGSLKAFYPGSGLCGDLPLYLCIKDRLDDFFKDGGKYGDSEEFLDYLTSRFHNEQKYTTYTTQNGEFKYILEDKLNTIPSESIVSDKTYTFKELIKELKKKGTDSYPTTMHVALEETKTNPMREYIDNVNKQVRNEIKAELEGAKNIEVTSFRNKQLLKSAGIGALVVGILSAGGILICNKIKQSKQQNKSA